MHPNSRRRGPDIRMVPSCTFDGVPFTTAVDFSCAIDSGATAKIYKGEIQASQPLIVAVKVVGIFNDVQEQLLARELRAARQVSLTHDLILAFLGMANVGQHTAIVSLYMRNGNFMDYIKANKDCDKTRLIRQVAKGVNFLHTNKNLVHGDIKCANVLISDFGDALLADFGLSTFIERNQLAAATMTAIRNMNTLRFAAPEILTGGADPTMKPPPKTRETDVYAFGMLVLEAVTENPPWHGLTDLAVMLRVSAGEHPPRPMNGPLVSTSHAAWELCLRCWRTDPKERITMESFLGITSSSTFAIGPYRSIKTDLTQKIRSIAYMPPDGRRIVSGTGDGDIYIWDAGTGLAVLGPMRGHNRLMGIGSVFGVAVSPDGRQIISSGIDDTLRRWDAASGTPVGNPIRSVRMSHSITYSPDGNYFAYVEEAGIRLWTASGCEAGKVQSGLGDGYVHALAFSPDSGRIAAGISSYVCIWDMATGNVLSTVPGNPGTLMSLAFSPDGTRLAVTWSSSALRVWNFSAARYDLELGEESVGSSDVAFIQEGNFLVEVRAGTVRIWDAWTAHLICARPYTRTQKAILESLSLSPDRRSLSHGEDDGIVIWDLFA